MKKFEIWFLIVGIMLIPVVLALGDAGYDNYKRYDSDDKYGTISIYDTNLFGKDPLLVEYTLEENTEICNGNQCYAKGTATLYTNEKLFSDVKFYDLRKKLTSIQTNQIYLVYYEIEFYNDTTWQDDKIIGVELKNRTNEILTPYNYEILNAGTYEWKIKGTVGKYQQVDWVTDIYGIKLDEWAEWKYGANVTDTWAGTYNAQDAAQTAGPYGMKIHVNNDTVLLHFGTAVLNTGWTSCGIIDSSFTQLANGTVDVPTCRDVNYTITGGESYYLWVNDQAASFTLRKLTPASFNYTGTHVNWTGGLAGGGAGWNPTGAVVNAFAIQNLTTRERYLVPGTDALNRLYLCNDTHNIVYANFSYQDEESSQVLNGTFDAQNIFYWNETDEVTENRTLTYTNSSEIGSYAFCYDPPDLDISLNIPILQYTAAGYPGRRWKLDTTSLTNTTTNKILYLLATADGSYSVYQTQTTAGTPISGVSVTVERQFSGTWTLVESGTTDDAGSVTFWLNPDYDHRLTFTRTGYTSVTKTIRPSSATYTVIMETSVGDVAYNATMEGISWFFYPPLGRIPKDINQLFEFNLTAENLNLLSCNFTLSNVNDVVLNTTQSSSSTGGCNISMYLNTGVVDYRLFGSYYVNLSGLIYLIDSDAYWITNITDYKRDGTLWSALNRMKDLKTFGEDEGRVEYSRIVFFFLMIIIVWGIISFSTGWDFQTQGGVMWFLCIIMWMASFTGFLNLAGLTPWTFVDKYIAVFIISLMTFGYSLNAWRRVN